MAYEAIITPITNIRPHPNADRLVLGTAAGYQVIVSKDTQEDTLGVFFPSDGQLSKEMCRENNLHRHSQLNKNPKKKGFFEDNRRVKTQKFRGVKSEGFWLELEALEFTGTNLSKLKAGKTFSELGGVPICNKYYTKATRAAQKQNRKKTSKWGYKLDSIPYFTRHWDTQKLRIAIDFIPEGAILSFSEKCHGTSGRTGYVLQERRVQPFFKIWNATLGCLGLRLESHRWIHISGTRKVTLNPNITTDTGFYSGKKFRSMVHQKIANSGIAKGETFYYEIVGFSEDGGFIMPSHSVTDKKLKKRYGPKMTYTYGCKPGEYRVLVYRITRTTPDGRVTELPLYQMLDRCKELGLEYVPQLSRPYIYNGDREELLAKCASLAEGHSILDPNHIREGVVVRVEAPNIQTHYKYKSWWFCELEGIAKNSDNFVDPEEVS